MNTKAYLEALRQTGLPVYHHNTKAMPRMPYMTYTEYGERYAKANNRIDDTIILVQLDLFTDKTDKAAKKTVKEALDTAGVVFTYTMQVENEDNDKDNVYLHHIFDCEVYEA